MKKFVCQYAIVRFLPYLETGEFANVGIVMSCPEIGFFDFKLLIKVRRITAFFEELDAGIYRRARSDFQQELQRIRNALDLEHGGTKDIDLARHLFFELTRPREVMLRFEETRVVLAENPAQQLEELFGHYVKRNFATKAYQEKLLESVVRKTLADAQLNKQYQAHTIGNADSYHARFPFVHRENGQVLSAIKPLHLAHPDPVQLHEHGWAWYGKVDMLRERHMLPERVLFPVQGPTEEDGERFEIFNKITRKLAANDIFVVDTTQTAEIVKFARG
jgi:Protein of unknown function (DUF3037)